MTEPKSKPSLLTSRVQNAARKFYRDNYFYDPDIWPNWRIAYMGNSGWHDLGGTRTLRSARKVAQAWSDHLSAPTFLLNLNQLDKPKPVTNTCTPNSQQET